MHGLSEDELSLSETDATALDQDVVVVDDTVSNEATHRGDVFLGQVVVSGGVSSVFGAWGFADSVDSLVHFGSVVETQLTSTGDGPLNVGGVP